MYHWWMLLNDGFFSFLYLLFHFSLNFTCRRPFGDTLLTVVRIFTFQCVIIKVQLLSGTMWCSITLTCCSLSTLCHNGLIWTNQYKAINWDYYINTNEIPGKLSRENLISSRVKITCYLHVWKYHSCYGYIIGRAFHTKKLLKRNGFFLVLKKYCTRSLRSLVKYFSTLEEKFRISARPCNILYIFTCI